MALNIPSPDFGGANSVEEKLNILLDSYAMLRKELEYSLQNLSFANFDSISAKNITGMNIKGGNININDAFIVDGDGNLIAHGNINLDGNIVMGGNISWESPVVQYQYSTNNLSWHVSYVEGDIYRRESFDNGTTWGVGYQFIGQNGLDGIDGTNGSDGSDAIVPSYIKSTYIDQTKILSPDITGGIFNATGQGRNGGAAYYIYNGVSGTGPNTIPVNMKGYISYDNAGAGTPEEATNRVFLKTLSGVALKIESGGDMSIESGGTIHIISDVKFYGSTEGIVAKFG